MMAFKEIESAKNVLLVGEGNFSFSVALVKKFVTANLTSTCFEGEEELGILPSENKLTIEGFGGKVYTSVDATGLSDHPIIGRKRYDFLVFNFPHIRGKMKICKNRLLLKNFFLSASKVMSPGGKILVTLCHGQSGTPVDNVDRKWEDSWQIVDLAACANLILKDVHPFNCQDFEGYIPFGYRGKDKAFNTDGAFTFTFMQGKPVEDPFQLTDLTMNIINNGEKHKHQFLLEWIKKNNLKLNKQQQASHLVHGIKNEIISQIQQSLERIRKCASPLLCSLHGSSLFDCKPAQLVALTSNCYDFLIIKSILRYPNVNLQCCSEDVFLTNTCLPCKQPGFRGLNFHEYLILIGCNVPRIFDCFKKVLRNFFHDSTFANFHDSFEFDCSVFDNLTDIACVSTNPSEFLCDGSDFAAVNCNKSNANLLCSNVQEIGTGEEYFATSCHINAVFSTKILNGYQIYHDVNFMFTSDSSELLSENGSVNVMKIGEIKKFWCCKNMYVYLRIDVANISLIKYNIFDERTLYSEDSYFTTSCESAYRPMCLYSPSHVHDTSFWITESFSEAEFFSFLLYSLHEYLLDVHLIDEYYDTGSGRTSFCYRFVYCCVERPLSKDSARNIHVGFTRKILHEIFGLDMR